MNQTLAALLIFVAMYVLLLIFSEKRWIIALAAAVMFGLLIGATLGGNITPVGASANIAGIGILQKENYMVTLFDFIRIGVPFTIISALSGALVIWAIWS